ncbi:MAG: hypothetical protein KC561_01860, partial [Myxococcales bacterium]|nr:hypothetical protein [Myxococcales bacterium]
MRFGLPNPKAASLLARYSTLIVAVSWSSTVLVAQETIFDSENPAFQEPETPTEPSSTGTETILDPENPALQQSGPESIFDPENQGG